MCNIMKIFMFCNSPPQKKLTSAGVMIRENYFVKK